VLSALYLQFAGSTEHIGIASGAGSSMAGRAAALPINLKFGMVLPYQSHEIWADDSWENH